MWVIGQYFVWVVVSEALFWVSVGYFGWVGHYLGWGRVSEGFWGIILGGWWWVWVSWALFWVGGVGWENILDEWGWAVVSGGGCMLFDNVNFLTRSIWVWNNQLEICISEPEFYLNSLNVSIIRIQVIERHFSKVSETATGGVL